MRGGCYFAKLKFCIIQDSTKISIMSIVKVSWSGGKDSTCSMFMHLERGDKVKAVCYIPYFTEDIPLISKSHIDFIYSTKQKAEALGAQIYIVHGLTYYDYFYKIKSKGEQKGKIRGFVCFLPGACEFKNYSKIPALTSTDVGEFDYLDLGIAFDEVNRQTQLNDTRRSILVETETTEALAFQYCYNRNILSPHYQYETRDGCAICPQASNGRFERWLAEYPLAKPIILQMQADFANAYPSRFPLRNSRWFIDVDQYSFFEEY